MIEITDYKEATPEDIKEINEMLGIEEEEKEDMKNYVLTDEAKKRLEKLANLDYKKAIAYFAAFCGYSFGIKVAASVLKNFKKLGFFSLIGGAVFSMYMGNQLGVFMFKCFEAAEEADKTSKEREDGGNQNKA